MVRMSLPLDHLRRETWSHWIAHEPGNAHHSWAKNRQNLWVRCCVGPYFFSEVVRYLGHIWASNTFQAAFLGWFFTYSISGQHPHPLLVGGFNLPLWKMMDFVSWDDDIPNWMDKPPSSSPVSFPEKPRLFATPGASSRTPPSGGRRLTVRSCTGGGLLRYGSKIIKHLVIQNSWGIAGCSSPYKVVFSIFRGIYIMVLIHRNPWTYIWIPVSGYSHSDFLPIPWGTGHTSSFGSVQNPAESLVSPWGCQVGKSWASRFVSWWNELSPELLDAQENHSHRIHVCYIW